MPREIKKIPSLNIFQKVIAQIKTFLMVSLWQPMKRLAYGRATLVPMALPKSCLPMNESLLFFSKISSNISIARGLKAPRGRVLTCNFMWCSTDSMPSFFFL